MKEARERLSGFVWGSIWLIMVQVIHANHALGLCEVFKWWIFSMCPSVIR